MTTLAYWIQRADFTTTDYDPVDVAGALRALDAHPWHDELKFQTELENAGGEYCPPGIGFVDPDGPFLHVCPAADGRYLVHFHAKQPVAFCGLSRRRCIPAKGCFGRMSAS